MYAQQLSLDLYAVERTRASRHVRDVADPVPIKSPGDAARYLMERIFIPFHAFQQEEFWVLLLNNKGYVTHEVMLYRGTINTVMVRMAEVFREAVKANAPAIIVSHQHPSGDPTPSPDDIRTTKGIRDAATILDIELLDHLVIGKGRFVSMKEQGLGF